MIALHQRRAGFVLSQQLGTYLYTKVGLQKYSNQIIVCRVLVLYI